MMWISCGRLEVPLLAQPERAVKLFWVACTGCPVPTGSSSQGLRNKGPAERTIRIRYEYGATLALIMPSHDGEELPWYKNIKKNKGEVLHIANTTQPGITFNCQ